MLNKIDEIKAKEAKLIFLSSLFKGVVSVVSRISPFLTCYVIMVLHKKWIREVTVSESVQLIAYASLIKEPVSKLLMLFQFLPNASVCIERLEKVMNSKISEDKGDVGLAENYGEIELKNLSTSWKVFLSLIWFLG